MEKDKIIKRQKIITLILAIVIVALVAVLVISYFKFSNNKNEQVPQQQESVASELEGLPVYRRTRVPEFTEYSQEDGVKFGYPYNWIAAGNDEMPMFVRLDDTGTTVNFTTADYIKGLSIDFYMEGVKEQLKQTVEIDGEITQEIINLNGRKAYKIDYVAKQEQGDVHVIQTVFIDDSKAYVLTVTTGVEVYDEEKPELEKIIKSFRKE